VNASKMLRKVKVRAAPDAREGRTGLFARTRVRRYALTGGRPFGLLAAAERRDVAV
jgi:hypothetical protein